MTAPSLAELRARDRTDPLARHREAFVVEPGRIYLDGNSLGLASHAALAHHREVAEQQWARDAIASWTQHDWIHAPTRLGDKIARLIGAAPGEVVVGDSTTLNLFRLLVAGLGRAGPQRTRVVVEAANFPADNYIAEGVAAMSAALGGRAIELVYASAAELDAGARVDERTAAIVLSHVNFLDASVRDMAAICAQARACGALTIWDLAHSAGAMPVGLGAHRADLAVGCSYKYLNGGPGAPAFCYVRRGLQAELSPPTWGWLGHAEPFAFSPRFEPADGIRRFVCGTPPILALAPLEAALDLLLEVDLAALRTKGQALSQAFIELVDQRCGEHGLEWACAREAERRGNQAVFRHPHAYAVVQALIDRGVIADFRAPDHARFGFAPLYLRYVDVYDAVERLAEVLDARAWDREVYRTRKAVT